MDRAVQDLVHEENSRIARAKKTIKKYVRLA